MAAHQATSDIDLIMGYLEALNVEDAEAAAVAAMHVAQHGAGDPEGLCQKCLRLINQMFHF